jgi:hypothetical protein
VYKALNVEKRLVSVPLSDRVPSGIKLMVTLVFAHEYPDKA